MLRIGIDTLIMTCVAILCVLGTVAVSAAIPLSKEEGDAAIFAMAVGTAIMVAAYVVMAMVLDSMV